MFLILFRSIRMYSWLRILVLASICSSIGSRLTYMLVYGELTRLNASPSSFSLAFILTTLTGYLGTYAGKYLLSHLDAKYCFLSGQILAALDLLLPWYGIVHDSVTVLQLTGAVSAFAAGIIGPASSYYFKARLASEDIGAAAVLDTLTMPCQIVFGMGIGFCLYCSVPYSGYLLADASGTLLAITCMLFVPKLGCRTDRNAQVGRQPKGLSSRQRAGLYILPALGMVGVPALTLLPNLLLDAGHGSETLLLLLLARSAGQLIGPFMVREKHYKEQSPALIIGCMAVFLLCYIVVPMVPLLGLAFVLVLMAHVFSDIVHTMGFYALLAEFSQDQIGSAVVNTSRKALIVNPIIVFQQA